MLQFQNLLLIYHTLYTAVFLIYPALVQVNLQYTSDISHFLLTVLSFLVEFFLQISSYISALTLNLYLSS
ncbi:hypothetical protein AXF42_Ash017612 [Apostasia shenzhenica]|uniref:Uncharacterized protein n=1 Tax=Apostasia shenzhenica TaxID=1088818 RepID=A0A2I0A5B8_9ASPA|nr:hypothetical protein AXF42_Ash017612 [Apostasia shenzhenica]